MIATRARSRRLKIETPHDRGAAQSTRRASTTSPRSTAAARARSVEAPHIAPTWTSPSLPRSKPRSAPASRQRAGRRGRRPRVSRFTVLAASLAAGGGARRHGRGACSLRPGSTRPTRGGGGAERTWIEEVQALKEQVVQARVELAALKVEHRCRPTAAPAPQFTRIGERVERIERMQAEPVAKLTKAVEALDRMRAAPRPRNPRKSPARSRRRRRTVPSQPAIGSKAGSCATSIAAPLSSKAAWASSKSSRATSCPGLGRVDAIRKQDGRWVVVTSKGLISPAADTRSRSARRSALIFRQAAHCRLTRLLRRCICFAAALRARWRRARFHGRFCTAQRASGHAACVDRRRSAAERTGHMPRLHVCARSCSRRSPLSPGSRAADLDGVRAGAGARAKARNDGELPGPRRLAAPARHSGRVAARAQCRPGPHHLCRATRPS